MVNDRCFFLIHCLGVMGGSGGSCVGLGILGGRCGNCFGLEIMGNGVGVAALGWGLDFLLLSASL